MGKHAGDPSVVYMGSEPPPALSETVPDLQTISNAEELPDPAVCVLDLTVVSRNRLVEFRSRRPNMPILALVEGKAAVGDIFNMGVTEILRYSELDREGGRAVLANRIEGCTRQAERSVYREMVDHAADPIYTLDSDGRFVELNDAAVEMSGYDRSELLGMKARETVSEKDHQKSLDHIEQLRTGSADRTLLEFDLIRKDGDTVPVEVHFGLRDPAAEEYRGVVGMLRDISDRKDRERALERQTRDMELLNRILRHDIRNDMQYILTVGELIEREVDDEAAQQRFGTLVERAENVVELTRTVRDLVDAITADGSKQLGPQPLDDILWDEIDQVQQSSNAIVEVSGIPTADVRADEMLHSLFRNLLQNGIEHNDKELPELDVSASVTDGTATVRIADNGPGIDDEMKDEIFGRGEKGLESSGTGIGLYLVEILVDRYGGTITVDDNEPDGAVFTVTLDVAE